MKLSFCLVGFWAKRAYFCTKLKMSPNIMIQLDPTSLLSSRAMMKTCDLIKIYQLIIFNFNLGHMSVEN